MMDSISHHILFERVYEADQAAGLLIKLWVFDTLYLLIAQFALMQPVFGDSRNTIGTMCFVFIQLMSLPTFLTVLFYKCKIRNSKESLLKIMPIMVLPSVLRSGAFLSGIAYVGIKTAMNTPSVFETICFLCSAFATFLWV